MVAEGGRAPLQPLAACPAVEGSADAPLIWRLRGHVLTWDRVAPRAALMGVLNVTPDSFADGGRYLDPTAARARARVLVAEGADLLDIGAESTRPGSAGVSVDEELARLLPVLEGVLGDVRVPVSIDTSRPEVAEAALALGAHAINDVTALRRGPEIARLCARHGAGLVLMHMRGTPATMQEAPRYADLLGEVRQRLGAAAETARAAGLPVEAIAVDPGIGFGKTVGHNLALIRRLDALTALGYPVVLGPSRKSFIGALLDLPPAERLEGTLAACAVAALAGVHVLRVHDVQAVRRAVRVAEAIRDASDGRSA